MGSFGKIFTWFSVAGALAALSFAAVGCGGGDDDDAVGDGDADADGDGDIDGDADGDADNDNPDDGAEAVFVADTLAIGETNQGFDLDDHTTTDRDDPVGCGKVDGPGGIDNQLSPLVQGIVEGAGLDQDPNALLLEQIQSGSLLLLARMVDVDNDTIDPLVPLYFYLADDADDPADVANNLTGDGHFLVTPGSLGAGGTLEDANIAFEDGRLRAGMFDTPPSIFRLTVPLDAEGLELDLAIEKAQVVFHYSADGLTEGIVGGYVATEAILIALQNLDLGDVEIPVQLVRTVLSAQADIDAIPPGPTETSCTTETVADDCQPGQTCEAGFCNEPSGRCDALSLGLRFTAVPATIDGIAAAAAQ